MDRTAIILAGGITGGFKQDKGLINLANRPMIAYVLSRVQGSVDEILVCLKYDSQVPLYSQALPEDSRIIVDDKIFPESPLRGAYTGLLNARGRYSIILPCDTPFISEKLIDLLFDMAVGVNAVIPRWPDGCVEPLQAVYRTEVTLNAVEKSLEGGNYRMQAMIALLRNVRYISTLVIKEIDPKTYTFMNINTPLDLKKAEVLIKRGLIT
ncbi:MAG: molybdenum cofactor guanylyltransferase [Candidatus Bathyarchaeia archaeon]